MRRVVPVAAFVAALAGCGGFRAAPDVPPRTSATPPPGKTLALVTFAPAASAANVADAAGWTLRLRHVEDARAIDAAAGSRVVELLVGPWEATDICRSPCGDSDPRAPLAPPVRFVLEAGVVNDLGVVRATTAGSRPAATIESRPDGKEVLAREWPSFALPVRRAAVEE